MTIFWIVLGFTVFAGAYWGLLAALGKVTPYR